MLTRLKSIARFLRQVRRAGRFSRDYSQMYFGGASPPPVGKLEQYFDANLEGPGLWKWRHYFPIYERHFAKFIGTDCHIAEVGIYSGGSLPMWKSYFGDKARIYGVDIEKDCRQYEGDRVKVFIGDQADRQFWERFRSDVPALNVLIDDGGHEPEQQIVTLEENLPYLRCGGVYLCEDIHGSGNPFASYISGLQRDLHSMGPRLDNGHLSTRTTRFQSAIASIHVYPFCVVIEKTSAPVGHLEAPKHGTQWQPFL